MPNTLLPVEERDLTPDQVAALDKRRFRGLMLQVMGGILGIMATLMTVWAGQDFTYDPGWIHPMAFYFVIAIGLVSVLGLSGLILRSGTPRID